MRHKFFILIALGLGCVGMANAAEISPYKRAEELLPFRELPYTYNELWPLFEPYLSEQIKPKYEDAFKLMFNLVPGIEFPPPKHPKKVLLQEWRCWLGHVLGNRMDEQSQEFALMQVHNSHLNTLRKINPSLVKEVEEFFNNL